MPRIELETHLKMTLPAVASAIVTGGVCLSVARDDPHWVQRAGALIAALGAAAILMQIRAEIGLEERRDELTTQMTGVMERIDAGMPVEELAARVSVNRLRRLVLQLSGQRLRVASFVVSIAIMGELLHGFGDLLLCLAISLTRCHG